MGGTVLVISAFALIPFLYAFKVAGLPEIASIIVFLFSIVLKPNSFHVRITSLLLWISMISLSLAASHYIFDMLMMAIKIIAISVLYMAIKNWKSGGHTKKVLGDSLLIFVVLDTIYRVGCFGSVKFSTLLIGPLSYKRECSLFTTDSNSIGLIALIIFANLLFADHKKSGTTSYFKSILLFICILLSASKAAILVAIVFIFIKINWKLLVVCLLVGGYYGINNTNALQDDSLLTKIEFARVLLASYDLILQNFIIGDGWVEGQKTFAGDAEFAHSHIGILLGVVGVLPILMCILLMQKSIMRPGSYAALIAGLSYLNPFFLVFHIAILAY